MAQNIQEDIVIFSLVIFALIVYGLNIPGFQFVILLLSVCCVVQLYFHADNSKRKEKRIARFDLRAGLIWVFWVAYGYLFKELYLSWPFAYFTSVIVIILLYLDHTIWIRENDTVESGVFICSFIMLFSPNEDNIVPLMNGGLVLFRSLCFIFLYVCCQNDLDPPYRRTMFYMKFLRAAWILYISDIFIVFFIVQFAAVLYFYTQNPDSEQNKNHVLPTRNSSEKKEKKEKEKSKKSDEWSETSKTEWQN